MKIVSLWLLTVVAGYAQQYEVASIKPNADSDSRVEFRIEADGTLSATGITLKRLLMTAYSAQGFRIVGAPAWVDSSRWDIQAKPDRVASPGQVRPMLRALLEDRFQLRSHSEERELPVYELSVDTKGSKLRRIAEGETTPDIRVAPGSIQFTKATAATFASQLSYAVGRPVIDKTGLAGEFEFNLKWTPEIGEDGGPTNQGLPPGTREQMPPPTDGPSIFTAIAEQLGLRLRSATGPVRVTVIDAVQRPSDN